MALPVKLVVAQLVEAFPAFVKPYGSLAWPYLPSHSISLTSFSVWFSRQCLGLPSGLFPHISLTKRYTPLICPVRARCLAQLIVLGLIFSFFNEVYKCKSRNSWLCRFSPNSCYLRRTSGYFLQHPVLEHTPSQFERLVSNPFKTSGKNCYICFSY